MSLFQNVFDAIALVLVVHFLSTVNSTPILRSWIFSSGATGFALSHINSLPDELNLVSNHQNKHIHHLLF